MSLCLNCNTPPGWRNATEEASKPVGDASAKVYDQAVRAKEVISRSIAEQPLLALLVAGAIGYGIANLIHSDYVSGGLASDTAIVR